MLMTPQHQVKELRNEAGRNIVGGIMLCPELERMWGILNWEGRIEGGGGRYTHEKNEEGRRRGRNRTGKEEDKGWGEGEGRGNEGKERKGGMHMHTYVPVL